VVNPQASAMKFELLAQDGAARRGQLTLTHGVVETPVFMPVGTYGTVKAMAPDELVEMGATVVLGNTFHLWLRPGLEVIAAHGGLHRFMAWERPILTDSGGFQVFSLGELRKISEEGVHFSSPINGDRLFLTPEISMQIQQVLNSDIAMIFDECTPYPATVDQAAQSMRLSLRWARRSRDDMIVSVIPMRCLASFKAACMNHCAMNLSRGWPKSILTDSPLAVYPSVSRKKSFRAFWRIPPLSYLVINHDISWV
jgi:hypothetical protein